MYVESSLIEWLRFQAILDNIKYRAIRYFVGTSIHAPGFNPKAFTLLGNVG